MYILNNFLMFQKASSKTRESRKPLKKQLNKVTALSTTTK